MNDRYMLSTFPFDMHHGYMLLLHSCIVNHNRMSPIDEAFVALLCTGYRLKCSTIPQSVELLAQPIYQHREALRTHPAVLIK